MAAIRVKITIYTHFITILLFIGLNLNLLDKSIMESSRVCCLYISPNHFFFIYVIHVRNKFTRQCNFSAVKNIKFFFFVVFIVGFNTFYITTPC